MKTLYTAAVTVVGGREGTAKSSDGLLKVELALPRELGGSGAATNPEQLFAAGYAACFEGAVRFLARQRKLPVNSVRIDSAVSLLDDGDAGWALAVKMAIHIGGLDQAAAEKLVHDADSVCPYSKAIRGNVDVVIDVRTD